ncbi:MAG: ABC transporter substrate-binding protein [Gemmatimonadales bacterium]|jgi:peptide/nickel transport system substrate-binding protein
MVMMRVLIGSAAVWLASTGCFGGGERAGTEADADTPRFGGTVVVASLTEASSMNRFASVDDISQELQNYVLFTTLIRYDESLEPIPYLAERWDTTSVADGLALTFYLRDDLLWHDGLPTTAHDVKFTFDRIKDPNTGYPRASVLANYDSAAVQDSFTITFFLKRHPGFMDPWRTIAPMPEHLLGDVPPAELRQHPFGSQVPIGNGPFRFVEHRTGDRWVFEANPTFPDALGGRPYVDRLVYRYIEEPTTRFAELLTGEVDVYLIVAPAQVAEIEAAAGARIISYANRNYAFINWNSRRPLFEDRRVRRALTLAIDRQEIVDAVQRGLGQVAKGSVPPNHWAYHTDLAPIAHDPDSARSLLDAAGWLDNDGDGVRERNGLAASFELATNPNPTREDIMTLVQADLRQVGIDVRTRVQESQSLAAAITSPERSFDAFVLGWQTEFNLDDRPLFACSALDGPYQWAGYCNPRVDEILDVVTVEGDRQRTLPLWHEYQGILQTDQPYTFLYYDVRANGVRDRVHNVRMDIRGDLINVKDWWLAADEQG